MQIYQRLIGKRPEMPRAIFVEFAKHSVEVKITRSSAKLKAQIRKRVVLRFFTIAAMKRN